MSFKNDLEIGKRVEAQVAEVLQEIGYSIEFNNSKDKNQLKLWDLKGIKDNKELKFEIKADFKYIETGNVAIEVNCVLESEADIFIYKLANEFWYTTTNNLRCELNKTGKYIHGGDGGRSYMKLVKGEDFLKYCKKLK